MPLLPEPSSTRLVTIIAHVDHGKTTLCDSLISSNGIISDRLAGSLRYLDSLSEEQRRGITMRASAISLRHSFQIPRLKNSSEMVIHLVDSPGHVDFCSEVTSSLLLCDCALLVVDAVEGMCARTHALIREARMHEMVPILVVNKVDRLCVELCLSPEEGYMRLRGLLESVNAACAAMVLSSSGDDVKGEEDGLKLDETQRIWNFDPQSGNVIFASALHGWGFSVPGLARSLFRSKTIPVKPGLMKKYLFGDFKFHPDTEKVTRWRVDSGGDVSCMFAEYALKPIWDIYEGVAEAAAAVGLSRNMFSDHRDAENTNKKNKKQTKITSDTAGMDRVLEALQIGNTSSSEQQQQSISTPRELQTAITRIGASSSPESILRGILQKHRPLSDSVLDTVCDLGPSPIDAVRDYRNNALVLRTPTTGELPDFEQLQNAMAECDPNSPITIAHVCKFASTDVSSVTDPDLTFKQQQQQQQEEGDDTKSESLLMGLTRVLSGTLHSDTVEYYAHGPKHLPHQIARKKHIRLYLLMGSSFVRVDSVPAGHICAVHDLEDLQFKTVTLCNVKGCMPLQGFDWGLKPLVKVNVEPVSLEDTDELERALLKLSLYDQSIEITATSRGERLLAALGELHLEQSLEDLREKLCPGIQLRISDPIVDFGEGTGWFTATGSEERQEERGGGGVLNEMDYQGFFDTRKNERVVRQVTLPPYCEEEGLGYACRGRCRAILSGRGGALHVRVVPLSTNIYETLKNSDTDQSGASDGCNGAEDDILNLAKVLNCQRGDTRAEGSTLSGEGGSAMTPEEVCQVLRDSISVIDEHGNVMVESSGVKNGHCVKAILTNDGEVHIPPRSHCGNHDGKQKDDSFIGRTDSKSEGGSQSKQKLRENLNINGSEEYDAFRQRIREGGIGPMSPYSQSISGGQDSTTPTCSTNADRVALDIWKTQMRGSVMAGFQLAMRSGPLCEEPVRGVMVILEGIEIAMKQKQQPHDSNSSEGSNNQTTKFSTSSSISGGMVVASLRSGIRCALLTRPARLVEGHLKLTLHSSLAGLGPLYGVLSKRRGRVISDDMVDSTDLIRITASLPQAESMGLSVKLLDESSGEVTAPELVFSHWEVLDEDPFWIPTSLEEREDYGEIVLNGDCSTGIKNNALRYIRMVRKRKGLMVDSKKIVVAAEKQRTLARKK